VVAVHSLDRSTQPTGYRAGSTIALPIRSVDRWVSLSVHEFFRIRISIALAIHSLDRSTQPTGYRAGSTIALPIRSVDRWVSLELPPFSDGMKHRKSSICARFLSG
jgi:hypothetical protein